MKVFNDTDHDNDNDFTYEPCNRFANTFDF